MLVDVVYFNKIDSTAIYTLLIANGLSIVRQGRMHFRVEIDDDRTSSLLSQLMEDPRVRTIDPVLPVKHC